MLPKSYSAASKNALRKRCLGKNPYTDKQLITNMIRLLLTTGLYIRAFEDWDQLAETAKTWIEFRQLIQEGFQRLLNVTAPTAGPSIPA